MYIERLEAKPEKFLPNENRLRSVSEGVTTIDLDSLEMHEIIKILSKLTVQRPW